MSRRYSVAGPWINDGTLPPDWEEMVDSETGKSYFVDHNLKITSWVDPRDLFMKPEKFEECADGGFALGWERAVDPLAGEYFVNHNTWETTFEDPRLPPAQRTRLPIQAQDLMDESIGPVRFALHPLALSTSTLSLHRLAFNAHASWNLRTRKKVSARFLISPFFYITAALQQRRFAIKKIPVHPPSTQPFDLSF